MKRIGIPAAKCAAAALLFAAFVHIQAFAMSDKMFSYCLINPITGEIISEKNSSAQHAPASTTKILTAIIALEKCGADEIVTVSRAAANAEGSSAYTKEGDEYRMGDLLYGLMLNSGNDAAFAIAEHICGSTEAFAALMNEYAANIIGVRHSLFQNPAGLPHDGHYSTAYDMALIAAYAMKNEDFRRITETRVIGVTPQNRDDEIFYSNHNKLLGAYEGCVGVKTGYTKAAGRCLVSAAQRDGIMFIAVTMDDSDDWNTHTELLDSAFAEYHPIKVVKAGDTAGECGSVRLVYGADFVAAGKNGEECAYSVVRSTAENVPLNDGEKAGEARIMYDGRCVGTVDIIAAAESRSADGRHSGILEIINGICRKIENILF